MFRVFATTSLRALIPLITIAVLAAGPAFAQAQPPASASKPAKAARPAKGQSSKAAKSNAIVNINTASATDFEGLPGIGAKTAERIVEYRQKNGPFKKVEELMNVRGVGEKNFLKLKAQLTISPAKTNDDHEER